MKAAIIKKCMLVVLAALVISSVVSALILQNQYNGIKRNELREISSVLSQVSSRSDYENLSKKLTSGSPEYFRITYIAPSGKVLGDSEADTASMENHKNRPEVIQALKNGSGEDIRKSQTLGRSYMYVAQRMPDGNIVRVSVPLTSVYDHILALFPALLIGVLLALIVAPFLSLSIAGSTIRPFGEVANALRAVNDGRYDRPLKEPDFSELVPVTREINMLSAKISDTLRQLTDERRRVDYLLDNMNEGLVVLDKSLKILTVNRSALLFFGVQADLRGQNLLHLTHIPRIGEACRLASASGMHSVFDLPGPSGSTLQVFTSPVSGGRDSVSGLGFEGGAIMLITDVTAIRKAEQIRSEFVANASHELKTPLTSIKGFSELMETGIITEPEKMKSYLKLIRSETERMIVLINDILKLSELESYANSADPSRTPVSLRLIAQKVADSLALQSAEKKITVSVEGSSGDYQADPDRMTQLFLNLIDNAIKYNKPDGRVDVRLTDHPEGVLLSVEDTGVGIPEEARDRVFERFYRVDKSRSRKMGGTGLGLSIVKHIVGLYKGKITLESEVGNGTKIEIFLPFDSSGRQE